MIVFKCVVKFGDVIVIELFCYFGIIELIESLGLKVLEVLLCFDEGIWLDDLV